MVSQNVVRKIEKTGFKASGNGEWGFEIPEIGGAQIIDESGSTRDKMYGFGGKCYGIYAWDGNDRLINEKETIVYGTLNDAKSAARSILVNGLNGD